MDGPVKPDDVREVLSLRNPVPVSWVVRYKMLSQIDSTLSTDYKHVESVVPRAADEVTAFVSWLNAQIVHS